jgi:hypothetical protein
MSVDTQKLEIIEWLLKLKEASTIREIMKVKNRRPAAKLRSRKFGSGKNIFTYVADDFDATPEGFKDYMK